MNKKRLNQIREPLSRLPKNLSLPPQKIYSAHDTVCPRCAAPIKRQTVHRCGE